MIRAFEEKPGGRYTVLCETEYGEIRKFTAGELKRDLNGFYRFHIRTQLILSVTDCRMLAEKLDELNVLNKIPGTRL